MLTQCTITYKRISNRLAIAASLASVVFSTINSAICTIIVCFAEAPAELEINHGTHSREMREAWQKAYPLIRC